MKRLQERASGRGIRMCKVLCTKELDVFLGVREIGGFECKGAMGRMAQGEVLEGGRGQVTQWVPGHVREGPPTSTKRSIGDCRRRSGIRLTLKKNFF